LLIKKIQEKKFYVESDTVGTKYYVVIRILKIKKDITNFNQYYW